MICCAVTLPGGVAGSLHKSILSAADLGGLDDVGCGAACEFNACDAGSSFWGVVRERRHC